jgi:hypothetical protein
MGAAKGIVLATFCRSIRPPTFSRKVFVLERLVQIFGAAILIGALVDVFLTVLYARIGTGIMTPYLSRGMWRLFRWVGAWFPRKRDQILSYCAPLILIAMMTIWASAMIVGTALIVWPALGKGVRSMSGPTPTDFVTAIYFSGGNLTTSGTGEIIARTAPYKLLSVLQSFLGISIITLSVTYLLEVYTALQRRNTFALSLHHQTGATGDAVEMMLGLAGSGDFAGAQRELSTIALGLMDVYESHHFFWIVTYFRFNEPYYAIARVSLIVLETVTLIRSTLSETRYRGLIQSGAVTELWNAGMHAMREYSCVFLPKAPPPHPGDADDPRIERWRMRYREAIMKLKGAGVETAEDQAAGEEQYVALRREWDRYIRAFAEYMAHSPEEIDPAGSAVAKSADHREERQAERRRYRNAS